MTHPTRANPHAPHDDPATGARELGRIFAYFAALALVGWLLTLVP